MRHMTIIAALAVTLAMPLTAYGVDYSSEAAWEAECAGTPIRAVEGVGGADFREIGRVEYNGREETWYSSNVLRHYRTDEWTADEDGFYRTSEGLFVVATDAYPYGEIIETSRGPAQVLDCGCGWAIDFYTNWE